MTEMTSVGNDFFGFANAIELDHLTNEEMQTILEMFGDKN